MNDIATIKVSDIVIEGDAEQRRNDGLNGSAGTQILATIEAKMPEDLRQEDYNTVQKAGTKLRAIFQPSEPEECLVVLRRLKEFKGRRDAEQGAWAHVLMTLSKDLSKHPLWAVELAAERYRKDPSTPFFPNEAQAMMQLVSREMRSWRNAREIYRTIQHYEKRIQEDVF